MILRSTSLLLREQIKTVDISYNVKLDSVCFPFSFAWGGVKHKNVQPNKQENPFMKKWKYNLLALQVN